MTLIVEDGSIVPGANSYISVADATTYHANLANMAWANLAEPVQEGCLQKATQYMVGVYRQRWLGMRVEPAPGQLLDWPRIGVILRDTASYFVDQRMSYTVPANIVPAEVMNACAELALRASFQDLWPDLDQRTLKEKIGQIEIDYDRMSPQFRRFRQVDLMLNPYLDATNGLTTKLVRG